MVALLLMLWTPEAPSVVQEPVAETADPEYEACVARLGENIKAAREAAARWASEGGGAPAHHCLAVADLAAGFPKLAAIRLEELSERADAGDGPTRARILSQAALAWVEAGDPEQAQSAIDKAFAFAPESGELHLAAAKVHAANDRLQATIDAVTSAEDAGYVSADGYVLRGRARHNLSQHREAADDVVAALSIDPFHLDALVLRGDLARAGIEIEAYYTDADTAE